MKLRDFEGFKRVKEFDLSLTPLIDKLFIYALTASQNQESGIT